MRVNVARRALARALARANAANESIAREPAVALARRAFGAVPTVSSTRTLSTWSATERTDCQLCEAWTSSAKNPSTPSPDVVTVGGVGRRWWSLFVSETPSGASLALSSATRAGGRDDVDADVDFDDAHPIRRALTRVNAWTNAWMGA